MVLKQRIGVWVLAFFLFLAKNALSQSETHVSFDGTKISYTKVGKGAPVLLVHGFLNNRKSWEKSELFKSLLAQGFMVIVPDLRGNGDSDRPQEETAYQNNAEVKDLKGLMDALGFSKYDAIGYSRGSILLAKLLTMDTRIDKAVLGGMGIDFTDANWDRKKAFADAFNGMVTNETRGAVNYAKSIGADFRSLYLQQKYQPVTTKEALSLLMVPKVLVVAGDQDTDNGNPQELQKAIPQAQLLLVPGDHNTTYREVAFSKAVMDFIENK